MKSLLISLLVIFLTHLSLAKPIKVKLKLNWKYQFEFAGYIAAKEKGFYKKAGLDVKIIEYDKAIQSMISYKVKQILALQTVKSLHIY